MWFTWRVFAHFSALYVQNKPSWSLIVMVVCIVQRPARSICSVPRMNIPTGVISECHSYLVTGAGCISHESAVSKFRCSGVGAISLVHFSLYGWVFHS